ncbi:hypothetical protein KORDIASMS9_02784 [Kordia sp. SMS9]|uniref:hypothetical protein n=1 Tax=Kordia sp. SMS9 TaxID=2282170 RepID=UPI000E0DDE93|nr:hypothetical protein [Kordia sp. SMS9]AXG70544.1 hypothetical protein KORDIASMS9_02784 [Kordia sp. SMS9]
MKSLKIITIALSILVISCQKTHQNNAHPEIYDFMEIVIKEQKLDPSYALRLLPESRFTSFDSDSIMFNNLLFKIQQKKIMEKNKKEEEPNVLNEILRSPMNWLYYLDDITEEDIAAMKQQKKELINFKWDNSKLGFNQSNKKNWYAFSIPLFSKDKTKVVMMIKDLCSGLCGGGKTILFTKKDHTWTSTIGSFWYH